MNSATPDSSLLKRSSKNELIKVDESQFVTLSQVQDNRVDLSSGKSPYPASSSIYTSFKPSDAMDASQGYKTDLSAMTTNELRKANQPPSSTGLISDIENNVDTSPMVSMHSQIDNQLYATQIEHTQGRLAYFQQNQISERID